MHTKPRLVSAIFSVPPVRANSAPAPELIRETLKR